MFEIEARVPADVVPPINVTNTVTLNSDQGTRTALTSIRITVGGLPNTGEHPDVVLNETGRTLPLFMVGIGVMGGLFMAWRKYRALRSKSENTAR